VHLNKCKIAREGKWIEKQKETKNEGTAERGAIVFACAGACVCERENAGARGVHGSSRK
jgi:hypothetical protein